MLKAYARRFASRKSRITHLASVRRMVRRPQVIHAKRKTRLTACAAATPGRTVHRAARYRVEDIPARRNLSVLGQVVGHAGMRDRVARRRKPKERQMKRNRQIIIVCAVLLGLSSVAQAGPCSTSKSTELRDAGSGPTPGKTGTTVGTSSNSNQHPPTSAMNQQAGVSPASPQDAQKQMQGQPTAARQAEGAKVAPGKMGENDC